MYIVLMYICLYSLDIIIRPFNGFMCIYVFKQKFFLFENLFETRSHYQKVNTPGF